MFNLPLVFNKFDKKDILVVLILAVVVVYGVYFNLKSNQLEDQINKQTAVIQEILEGNLPLVEVDGQKVSLVAYFNQRLVNLEPKPAPFGEVTPEPTEAPLE